MIYLHAPCIFLRFFSQLSCKGTTRLETLYVFLKIKILTILKEPNSISHIWPFTGGYNATANTTPTPFHHPAAQIREYLEAEETWWPCSPEFINYSLALLVYSVRYPAVFWNTNKGFAFLFSLQLLANSLQNLLALGGISIMYKVQMLGPHSVLHKYEPFLLNTPICMLLYR